MISKSEYETLLKIKNKQSVNLVRLSKELDLLKRSNLIKLHNVGFKNLENNIDFGYDGFEITQAGIRAIEEYQAFILLQAQESESLNIAKKANLISEEANAIANEANKKSRFANTLAIIAFVIPTAISIISLVLSIIKFVKG